MLEPLRRPPARHITAAVLNLQYATVKLLINTASQIIGLRRTLAETQSCQSTFLPEHLVTDNSLVFTLANQVEKAGS